MSTNQNVWFMIPQIKDTVPCQVLCLTQCTELSPYELTPHNLSATEYIPIGFKINHSPLNDAQLLCEGEINSLYCNVFGLLIQLQLY